jgi:plasmid maintenance system killer protein
MWAIREHTSIGKACAAAPKAVARKYELWKEIGFRHGPEKLREFPGFHDEKPKGRREGECSSRLNLQYRVIYAVDRRIVAVFVLEITPHKY